jgi:hypothetical protein
MDPSPLEQHHKIEKTSTQPPGGVEFSGFFWANKGIFGTKRPRLNWLDFKKKKKQIVRFLS